MTAPDLVSERAHAAIMRTVAARAVDDARSAWKASRSATSAESVRAAYRHAVLAARTLRRAAEVSPDESAAMLASAERADSAASALLGELVAIVEAPRPSR